MARVCCDALDWDGEVRRFGGGGEIGEICEMDWGGPVVLARLARAPWSGFVMLPRGVCLLGRVCSYDVGWLGELGLC